MDHSPDRSPEHTSIAGVMNPRLRTRTRIFQPAFTTPALGKLRPTTPTDRRMPYSSHFALKWLARRRNPPGTLEVLPEVYSPELGNRRDILVYLPAGYAEDP